MGTSKTKQMMKKLKLWFLRFLPVISNSGNANQIQMRTRKDKEISSRPHPNERVSKAARHNSPDASNNEFNAIGR